MSTNKILGVFTLLLILIAEVSYSQKKERYGWGQYTEVGGINYQNYPYTLFNRVSGTPWRFR